MNTRHPLLLFTVVLVAAASDSSSAQAENVRLKGLAGFGLADSNLVLLATSEAVQRELEVSGDVVNKLATLRRDFSVRRQQEFETAKIVFPISVAELSEKLDKEDLQAEFNLKVKEVLSHDQFKRLKQIQLQVQRVTALTNPDVAAELKLTADQTKKLTDLQLSYQPQLRELLRKSSLSVDPFTPLTKQKWATQFRELNAEFNDQSLLVLTAEQQRAFVNLLGQAFDVDQLDKGKQ